MVRILVTTRNKNVAEVMQTTSCFSPSNLPEDSCWQLFQHYAFSGTSDTVPTHLVNMGRDIMRKCGELPLAVKSIASLLRHETYEECWREILESDFLESNLSNDIFLALQISYAHLPAHLKPCFLFCSMYPKDYILEKMHLIELWICQGYIESKGKTKITEIGVEYYEELKHRSFLDSESEHCGFIGYVNQVLKPNLKGLRTLYADMSACSRDLEHEYCISNTEALNLNSKLSECYKECLTDVQICNLTKFEALRTSILNCDSLKCLPESIGDLLTLQFLKIQSANLRNLPKSLSLLNKLLRLFIGEDNSDDNLEDKFLNYVPHGLVIFPAIKTMKAWLRVETIAWLKDMMDLEGYLSICGVSNLKDFQRANMRNKCKLETLDLSWDPDFYTSDDTEKSELILTLEPEAYEDECVGVDDAAFSWLESLQPHPNLKKLQVRYYSSATVPGWMSDPSSLQSIKEVLLECCDMIQSLPFNYLHTLKDLTINSCYGFRVLQLEQLFFQLEKLQISKCYCLELITGQGNQDMLDTLKIWSCVVLKPIGESTKEKQHIAQQNISLLTSLEIIYCDWLCVLPDGLIPSGPSYVRVRCCGCPDIEIGDLQ